METALNPALQSLASVAAMRQEQAKTSALGAGTGQNKENASSAARQAAQDLEAVFLTSLVESMFAGVKTDGPFGGGNGESVYRSMLNEQYATAISKSGGVGIADNVYREILKMQEAPPPVTEGP